MTLHEDKTLFRQAVQFTADQLQIAAIYIEKDYWARNYQVIFSETTQNSIYEKLLFRTLFSYFF